MIEYTVGIFYLRWDLRPLRPSPALIILALWGSGITAPHPALRDIGAVGFESICILLTIMHFNIL